MASPRRKNDAGVIERLRSEPHRFTFFQAVRLWLLASQPTADGKAGYRPSGPPIGADLPPASEPLRFRSFVAHQFPTGEIHSLTPADAPRPPRWEVTFWGLIGPSGVLPAHYTQLVIDRVRAKDTALRDFLDLFSHRQLSFFYRAWEKYFVAAGAERAARTAVPAEDLLRECLLAIVGRGTPAMRDRLAVCDDALVYYGGFFVSRPANNESLQRMIGDFLGLPTRMLPLVGQWLRLPRSEQSRLGGPDLRLGGRADDGLGMNSRLGVDTVIGERIWDAPSKFRLRIGPVDLQAFRRLMPIGDRLVPTCQLIRSYVGPQFDFDLQVVLLAADVPACLLSQNAPPCHLGWNSWLISRPPSQDADDAVFFHDGAPLPT